MVLGIAGSPRARDSVTMGLVEAAADGAADAGADAEVLKAAQLVIGRCRGCGECSRTGRCALNDDLAYLLERLDAADGIILGSPSSAGGVASPIATIMGRMDDVARCRRLEGRYGAAIAVSRDGDEGYVLGRLGRFLDGCGVAVTGGLAVGLGENASGEEALPRAAALGRELVAAIREKRRFPAHEAAMAQFIRDFRATIEEKKDTWAFDYSYWREKGWL